MTSPRDKTEKLLIGILNAIRDRGGSTNKTKLLKFLYLADIAYYRAKGEMLTCFHWIFHLYGPWTSDFDPIVSDMVGKQLISVTEWEHDEGEAQYFKTENKVDLNDLIDNLDAQHELSLELDSWADKPLGELLDHIYFETEPMRDAKRGSSLDFRTVDRTRRIRSYRRLRSYPTKEKIAEVRAKLVQPEKPVTEAYTSPRYDEDYVELMESLDSVD